MAPPAQRPITFEDACPFHGGGPDVTRKTLRHAIAKNATDQRAKWFVGGALQDERVTAFVDDLVQYWLAGIDGRENQLDPDTLVAAEAAAAGLASSDYTALLDAIRASASRKFIAADAHVDRTAGAFFKAADDVDRKKAALDDAAKKEREAAAVAKAAADAAEAARKDVERLKTEVASKTATQAALDTARAEHARLTKEKARVDGLHRTARRTLRDARTAHDDAVKARRRALLALTNAKSDANALAGKATAAASAAAKGVAVKLRGVAKGVPEDFAKMAASEAHRSRVEAAAWSAVFVVWCVRHAAIAHKLEWTNGTAHEGKNGLLTATFRHSKYIRDARDRAPTGTGYFAYRPDQRSVHIGDIIATDRVPDIVEPIALASLSGNRELHCDIVTDIRIENKVVFAETVGGNVGDTVRRRRFPLDDNGMLIRERGTLYAEENASGQFPTPFAFETRAITPSVLPSRSARRVFAVLSLVGDCAAVKAGARRAPAPSQSARVSPWRVATRSERLMPNTFEQLESPFLDEEVVVGAPRPAGESAAEAAVERAGETPFLDRQAPFLDGEAPFLDAETDTDFETDYETDYETEAESDYESDYESDHEGGFESAFAADPELGLEADFATEDEGDDENEGDFEDEGDFEALDDAELGLEAEWKDLAPASTPDDAVAQTPFSATVRARPEPLLDAKRARAASRWNAARHPAKSGIDVATLLARLDRYVDRAAVERAMQGSAELRDLAGDQGAVLAVVAHQFQQKILAPPPAPKPGAKAAADPRDGQVGERTLDALGYVRHRDASLNRVDKLNVDFHVAGNTKAYRRVKEAYRADRAPFDALGGDVTPENWYYLFVDAPFLGRPFDRGVHVELMRRLRLAERWLLARPQYRDMSPVELGAALGIDEDHHGGRAKATNSMHTLGLAVDVGYVKNPWVAGQHDNAGQPNARRNGIVRDVTRNAALLLAGVDEPVTAAWLSALGNEAGRTTDSAFAEIQRRHAWLVEYMALRTAPDRLRAAIERRRAAGGPNVARVIRPGQSVDAAVATWRRTIAADRARLAAALGGRKPERGFLNLHRDLVVALRDHGCLAWGAIDLGARACGDMMHFDCRPSGLGWALSLPRQRTAGANHPCVAAGGAVGAGGAGARELEEWEQPDAAPPPPPPPTSHLGGRLWTFKASTLPLQVGVFVPKAVAAGAKSVEVLVFAHGHLDPCPPVPRKMPQDMITGAPFRLAKLVDASNRAIVLVVPSLEWSKAVAGKLGFGRRGKQHLLGRPSHLNALVDEVLREIGRVDGGAAPALANLVIAGHSRAFDLLDPLAAAHADAEMSKGALARLTRVWALDTTYTAPVSDYTAWLAAKPALEIDLFFRCGTGTAAGGMAFEKAAPGSGGRLRARCVCEGHCAVPGRRLPDLLAAPAGRAPAATTGGVVRELDDETAYEDEGADEYSDRYAADEGADGEWDGELEDAEHGEDEAEDLLEGEEEDLADGEDGEDTAWPGRAGRP